MSNDEQRMKDSKFWEMVRDQVRQGQCDFRGRQFPEDPSLQCFSNMVFTDEANFEEAVFEGNAYFNQATFEKQGNFCGAIFTKDAFFRKVNFKYSSHFCQRGKTKTKFNSTCDFSEGIFHSVADFTGVIMPYGTFYNVNFLGGAHFGFAQFGIALFDQSSFQNLASFHGAQFNKKAVFKSVIFMRRVSFLDSRFNDIADFSGARCVEGVEMPLPVLNKNKQTFRLPELGITAYRFAKQSAASNSDSILASDYHYAERCALDAEKRSCWNSPMFEGYSIFSRAQLVFIGWTEFIFMRLIFGYGDKPLRVVGTSVLSIMIFSFCYWYWQMGCVSVKDTCYLTFIDALFVSLTTFTTLGYGDYHLPTDISKFLIGGEALLGAFLMSVFVVVLGRRYLE